jgi:hypothetical protein
VIRERLGRAELARTPDLAWNRFVDRIVAGREDPRWRPLALVFWYEAEVLNGGHLQYFVNEICATPSETLGALREFGLAEHGSIVERAIARSEELAGQPRPQSAATAGSSPGDVQQFLAYYSERAMEGEFSDLDLEFYDVKPTITNFLEALLERRSEEFFDMVD